MRYQRDIGNYTYVVSPVTTGNDYSIRRRDPRVWADEDNRVKSYDHLLHESLEKIFNERCLSSSDQVKEFLHSPQHNTDRKSIVETILEQEPDVFSWYFSKEELGKLSLLWITVLAGYRDSAELLVRSGADVNELFGRHDPQVIDENWSILHVLLQMVPSPENERLIRLVTDNGADLQARECKGQTVLHYAIEKSRVEMTEMLLEKGADVNVADNDGMTPLLVAAGNIMANELLPLLMKHGADIFVKNIRGENALHRLAHAPVEYTDLARVLIDEGVSLDDRTIIAQDQPIHVAATSGKNEFVNLFLDHGAKVNAQTRNGQFPLYCAVIHYNNAAVVETLLERGANVALKTTYDGHTALHAASHHAAWFSRYFPTSSDISEKWESIIRLLLSAGSDVFMEDYEGKTPFALISSAKNVEQPVTWLMIRVLALKKVCQHSIELKDEKIIEQHPKMCDYYRECIEEIERIKSTRFIETCTLLELLTKSYIQIAQLMLNSNFETKFKQCDLSGFSKYAEDILRAFVRAQKHYQPKLKPVDVISKAVCKSLPDLVVDTFSL